MEDEEVQKDMDVAVEDQEKQHDEPVEERRMQHEEHQNDHCARRRGPRGGRHEPKIG